MSVLFNLIPRLLSLPGALGCSPNTLAVLNRLTTVGDDRVSTTTSGTEAEFRASSVRSALIDLVDAITHENTLVVFLENIHDADPRSMSIVLQLAELAESRRLAVICSSRQPLREVRGAVQHRLQPLSRLEVTDLTQEFARPHGSRPGLAEVQRIACMSEGNPLYVRELVNHWAKAGTLSSLPASLEALVARRVDELDPEAALTLQTVALLDRFATIERLGRTLGFQTHVLASALSQLEASALVTSEGSLVACTHEAIATAAIAALGDLTRKALHRSIALTLEREAEPGTASGLLWDCAHHWDRAGEPHRGVGIGIRCAMHLLETGLAREAADLLAKVRPFCTGANQLEELLRLRARALYEAVDWIGTRDSILELRALAGDVPVRGKHDAEEAMLIEAAWRCDPLSYDDVMTAAMACVQCPEASGHHRLSAAVQCLKMAGNYVDEAATTSIYRVIQDGIVTDFDEIPLLTEAEMIFHTVFGDVHVGGAAAARLIELRRTAGSPAGLFGALVNAGSPLLFAGRVAEAETALLEALEIARRHRLAGLSLFGLFDNLAYIMLFADDLSNACRWHSQARAYAMDASAVERLAFERTGVAIALGQGRMAEALARWAAIEAEPLPKLFPRSVSQALGLRVRMRLLAGDRSVAVEEIELLRAAHLKMRARGGQDLATLGLLQGLCYLGRVEEASGLFREYLSTFRRERVPPLFALTDFARGAFA